MIRAGFHWIKILFLPQAKALYTMCGEIWKMIKNVLLQFMAWNDVLLNQINITILQ